MRVSIGSYSRYLLTIVAAAALVAYVIFVVPPDQEAARAAGRCVAVLGASSLYEPSGGQRY